MVHIRCVLVCCDTYSASYFLQFLFQSLLVISWDLFFCVCVGFFPSPCILLPARCSVPDKRWMATLAFTEVRTKWRKHAAPFPALSRNLVRRADTAPSRARLPTAQQVARPIQQQFFLARSVASKCDCAVLHSLCLFRFQISSAENKLCILLWWSWKKFSP